MRDDTESLPILPGFDVRCCPQGCECHGNCFGTRSVPCRKFSHLPASNHRHSLETELANRRVADPTVDERLRELDDRLFVLTAKKQEILKVTGVNIDLDEIAVLLLEPVRGLTAFLDSQDVKAQRKALFAFCIRIVADSRTKKVLIETDLTGMAQDQAVPGLPAELCDLDLPNPQAHANAQLTTADELGDLKLPE